MIEITKFIEGQLVDHGNFDIPQKMLNECMEAITDARGKGGKYRICVQWFSDSELDGGKADCSNGCEHSEHQADAGKA